MQIWMHGGVVDFPAECSDNENDFPSCEKMGVGYWSWENSPTRVRYSKVVADVFGVPIELGKRGLPFGCFVRAVHPNDRDRFASLVKSTQMVGGSFIAEYRTISSAGDLRVVVDRGVFRMGPDGVTESAHGVVIDLTPLGSQADLTAPTILQPALVELRALEQAAEHAMKLYKLIDVVPGGRGEFAKAALSQVLEIIGREISGTLGETVGDTSIGNATLN